MKYLKPIGGPGLTRLLFQKGAFPQLARSWLKKPGLVWHAQSGRERPLWITDGPIACAKNVERVCAVFKRTA